MVSFTFRNVVLEWYFFHIGAQQHTIHTAVKLSIVYFYFCIPYFTKAKTKFSYLCVSFFIRTALEVSMHGYRQLNIVHIRVLIVCICAYSLRLLHTCTHTQIENTFLIVAVVVSFKAIQNSF